MKKRFLCYKDIKDSKGKKVKIKVTNNFKFHKYKNFMKKGLLPEAFLLEI